MWSSKRPIYPAIHLPLPVMPVQEILGITTHLASSYRDDVLTGYRLSKSLPITKTASLTCRFIQRKDTGCSMA